ncbi:MAG TPA: DJ-1/PfpI family protein [Acidobacteriota bacterium]|nr:DJ-1/PfpI family protein [Acidobacteriota bacterium]
MRFPAIPALWAALLLSGGLLQAADRVNVGILVYPGVYNTEFVAPYDVFEHADQAGREVKVFLVAPRLEAITSAEGLLFQPDYALDDHPPIDILIIPSFVDYESDLEAKQPVIDWVRRNAHSADWVLSNCWGAFYLAQAGLLKGRFAMTYPPDIDKLAERFPAIKPVKDKRFVRDGKFITGGGGVASYENALYVVEQLWGAQTARRIASGLVLDWNLESVPHYVKKD